MNQARDEAGNIWEIDAAGNPVRLLQPAGGQSIQLKPADPNLAVDRAIKQVQLDKAMREAANSPVSDAKARLELERTRIALEKDRKSAESAPSGKPLREGDGNKLEENVGQYAALKGAAQSFQDDFGGNKITGGMENTAQKLFGTGTPGQADWWANFYATDNVIRNKLYGASLTDGEKQAYAATTIDPSMRPELIRSNLERRTEIVRGAMARKVARLKAAGFNAAEIDAAAGDYAPDFTVGYKPAKAPQDEADKSTRYFGSPANNGGNAGGQMSIAQGATRTEADPVLAGVNAKVNSLLKSGAPDKEIMGYLQQVGANASPASVAAALKFRRQNPEYKGNYSVDLENRAVPQSAARQAFQAVGGGGFGAYTTAAADALTAGRLDNIAGALGGNSEQVNAAKRILAEANPLSSLAGSVTGGVLAATGLEAAIGASGLATAGGLAGRLARSAYAPDVAYGAALGSDEGGAAGALMGAGAGLVGGALGNRAVGALRGVTNEAAQGLRARGIPLTIGQAVGQSGRVGAAIKGVEDRLSGVPVVGSFLAARRRQGLEAYNRAAFDEALAPVNGNTGGLIQEAGVDAAQNVIGDAYDNALTGVNVRADAPFAREIAGALRTGRQLPDPMGGRADYTIRQRVGGAFSPTRELSGRNYQQSIRGLRRDASAVRSEPYGYDFGQVTGDAEAALQGLLERQAPGTVPAVERANQAYRLTEVVRDAVNRSRNGARSGEVAIFAPSQLADAAASNARRFGNSQGTTRQPFFDLTREGQQVLPNAVPDSGTAGRLVLAAGLTGGGAGAGYLGENTQKGAAVGAALAALQTQAAQRALVAAVLNRPQRVVRAADLLDRYGLGATLGAQGAVQALPR